MSNNKNHNNYYEEKNEVGGDKDYLKRESSKLKILMFLAIPMLIYMQLGFYVATIMTLANSTGANSTIENFLFSLAFSVLTLLPSLAIFFILFTSKSKKIKVISYVILLLIFIQIDVLMGSQSQLSVTYTIEKANYNKYVERFIKESEEVINTQDKIFETSLGDYYYKDNKVTEITKGLLYNAVTDVTVYKQTGELLQPNLIYEDIEMYDVYSGGLVSMPDKLTNTTERFLIPRAIKLSGYPMFAVNNSININDTMKIELVNKLSVEKKGNDVIVSKLDNLDIRLEIDSRNLSYDFYDESDRLVLSAGNYYDLVKENEVIHSLLLNTKDKNDTSMSYKDYPRPISTPGKYKLIVTSYSSLISGYVPVADPVYFVNE